MQKFNKMTLTEKKIRSMVLIRRNTRFSQISLCKQQLGSSNSALIYPACSDPDGDALDDQDALDSITAIEAQSSQTSLRQTTSLRTKQSLSDAVMAQKNRIENYLESSNLSDDDEPLVNLLFEMLYEPPITHSELEQNNRILDELGI